MGASGPIPSSCVRDIHFWELRFVKADIGFLAGIPTIIRLEISITRAKQAPVVLPTAGAGWMFGETEVTQAVTAERLLLSGRGLPRAWAAWRA